MPDDGVTKKISDAFLKTNIDLDRYGESVKRKILPLLDKAQQEILGEIAKIDPFDPSMTRWRKERLTQLYKTIDEIVKATYGEIKKETKDSLKDVAGFAGEATPKTLNDILGIELFKVNLTPEFLKNIATNTMIDGHIMRTWWDKQAQIVREKIIAQINMVSQELSIGLIKGEAIGELVSRIRGTALTPGVMSMPKHQATALVRTSTMQVLQATRMETYKQNEELLKGYQVVATLDKRTTPLCRALDGKEYDLNFKPIGHTTAISPGPPFHWQCRSTLVPITKSYEELAKGKSSLSPQQLKSIESINPTIRASMGGPVSAKLDYNEWLLDQPENIQIEVLGQKRWQLWKDNKLTASDLIHQNGRPLTMEQLRKKYKI